MWYTRESLQRQHVVGYQTNRACPLLFAEGTRRIFITTDISMNDSATFKIITRKKETAVILGMTITFTIVDDPTNRAECEINAGELT